MSKIRSYFELVGFELVLKVTWRHPEAAHEADGLREWDGDGARAGVRSFLETRVLQ